MTTIQKSQSENQEFTISYFDNLWSTTSTVTTLRKLYQQTVSPLWQPKTESYRRLKDRPDRTNEAKMTKESMPAVIIEGIIRPNRSHAAANLETMNGLAMFDLDHCNERTQEIKDLFRQLPYVAYQQTSISGEGLKVIIYLGVYTPEQYPIAYAICRQTLEQIAGHPCDSQCARITQPCSCVWDPDAYLNPAPTPYPWREELATDPSLAQLANTGHYSYAPGSEPQRVSPLPPPVEACGYIETFVNNFIYYHPLQKGNRHESILALGRSARRKGFSKEELEKLTSIMAVRIIGNDYTMKELQKDLLAGYQYINISKIPDSDAKLLPQLPTATLSSPMGGNEVNEEEEVLIKNEEIRSSTPYIPNEVYNHLPSLLEKALKPARNKRERDILLLGVLVNLSGCMPNVRIHYAQGIYSPHLYLLVIAPPVSGKGILKLAGKLPVAIDNYLKGENKRKKEAYERELREWENNHHSSGKKPQASECPYVPMPEAPEYCNLCGAPNTSRNQIIKRLKINADLGLIINASELDMVSGSIKQDYGKFDDVFRAAFHHEAVATDYKSDNQIIRAELPRLALCLSGTPDQLPAFIHSQENGLFCRFTSYTCEGQWKYRSAAPIEGEEDQDSLYQRLSQEVLDMYFFFCQSPTEVKLTDSQWEEHTNYFDHLTKELNSENPNPPTSIALRGGLMVARIAAVLTAIRKAEGTMQMKDYYCTNEDFRIAMQIVDTTMNHSLLLGSSLPGSKVKPKAMQPYFRLRPVIENLPRTFTYKMVMEEAVKNGISERSASRYLKQMAENNYIDKQKDRYVKRKEFTAGKAKSGSWQ